MTTETVVWNLVFLVPLSSLLWVFVLPRNDIRAMPMVFWLFPLMVCIVPLGGFLTAMVALAFGEQLTLAPFSWIENPVFAAKVIAACGVVGGLFSFGLTKFICWLIALYLAKKKSALTEALALIGYSDEQPAHHKANLVSAISLHAGVTGQSDLEQACQVELARIQNN